MKTTKYLITAVAAAVLAGCNDLDTLPMGDTYTDGQRKDVVDKNPAAIESQMSAVYANLYAFQQNIDDYLNDFGYPATILGLENRGQDQAMVINAYGWFEDNVLYTDNSSTSNFTTDNWGTLYKTVYSSNNLLKSLNLNTDDPQLLCYIAQAKAMRAWAYTNLVQLYCKPYSVNPQAPGIPVVTELNEESGATTGIPRGTVADVYTQIISDLNDAITLLTSDGVYGGRYDKRFVDPAVACGLRARAYLLMGKGHEAALDADAAMQLADASEALVEDVEKPAFNSFAQRDFMWGIHIAENEAHGLYTFAGMMGSLTYGYAYAGQWRTINELLWDMIPDGDVRKSWWLNPYAYKPSPIAGRYGVGSSALDNYIVDNSMVTIEGYPAAAYPALVGMPDYAVVKFAPYQDELMNTTGATDIPLMRFEEMILIKAEGLAMEGMWTDAKSLIESFVNEYRWTDETARYTCAAASKEEMLDEIWFQRRIELWGEGFSYFDCLRLQKGIDRRGGGFPQEAVYNIPANDNIFQYMIPTRELEANILLKGQQNPAGVVHAVSDGGQPYWYKARQ
mgnify:FL=1